MILSVAFLLTPAPAYADLITYTLTGTVLDVMGGSNGNINPGASLHVAKGDRLAWTVQYDRSTPLKNIPSGAGALARDITLFEQAFYSPAGPMITHLVDQTSGYHFYTSPSGSIPAGSYSPQVWSKTSSLLSLSNLQRNLDQGNDWSRGGIVQGSSWSRGALTFMDHQTSTGRGVIPYFLQFSLKSNRLLPTLDLTKLQLDRVPFDFTLEGRDNAPPFYYVNQSFEVDAQVNSLSADGSLPEPGTLTLFALGILGLAVRRFRRPLC